MCRLQEAGRHPCQEKKSRRKGGREERGQNVCMDPQRQEQHFATSCHPGKEDYPGRHDPRFAPQSAHCAPYRMGGLYSRMMNGALGGRPICLGLSPESFTLPGLQPFHVSTSIKPMRAAYLTRSTVVFSPSL